LTVRVEGAAFPGGGSSKRKPVLITKGAMTSGAIIEPGRRLHIRRDRRPVEHNRHQARARPRAGERMRAARPPQ
jgi:hypothetical protein